MWRRCNLQGDAGADEIWEYRSSDPDGTYRAHIEFDDLGVVYLTAKIPDRSRGGKATTANTAPAGAAKAMSM